MQLNTELELVADLNPLDIGILQTARQRLRQIQVAEELKPLGTFVDNFELMVFVQLVLVRLDRPCRFVCVLHRDRVVRVQG